MNRFQARTKALYMGILVLFLGVGACYYVMPKEFFSYHNPDKALSPVGLALSKTYYQFPDEVDNYFQGYINDGEYHTYRNWPPSGFMLLANWFKLTGSDSTFSARIFSSIVFGLTGLLLFIFLLRKLKSIDVAFVSTLIFLVLPLNLDSSYFIYSDIWLNFFWLIGLLCLTAESPWRWWLLFLTCLIGLTFHWFIVFLFPAALLLNTSSRKRIRVVLLVTGLMLLSLLLIFKFVPAEFGQINVIKALRKHSTIGFFDELNNYLKLALKNLAFLGFQSFVIVFLYVSGSQKKKLQYFELRNKVFTGALGLPLKTILVSLAVMSFFFLQWVVVHRHFIMFTSIPIAIASAIFLQKLLDKSRSSMYRVGLSAVAISLVQFTIMTKILEQHSRTLKRQDVLISEYINKNQTEGFKPILIFDIPDKNIHNKTQIRKYAIREFTDSYIFEFEHLGEKPNIYDAIDKSKIRLSGLKKTNFEKSVAFFVSDTALETGMNLALDSIQFNGVFVYQLDISSKQK